MIKIVLDTNILVSALWTPAGNASAIISLVLSDKLIPCFDQQIMNEYRTVLNRPRLKFSSGQVDELLNEIIGRGLSVIVVPSNIVMPDESDRKFYDVAKYCEACLITGNIRHYPEDPMVTNPAGFFGILNSQFLNI
jgi:putative PIN family toxin of toxin-antitoxin system